MAQIRVVYTVNSSTELDWDVKQPELDRRVPAKIVMCQSGKRRKSALFVKLPNRISLGFTSGPGQCCLYPNLAAKPLQPDHLQFKYRCTLDQTGELYLPSCACSKVFHLVPVPKFSILYMCQFSILRLCQFSSVNETSKIGKWRWQLDHWQTKKKKKKKKRERRK